MKKRVCLILAAILLSTQVATVRAAESGMPSAWAAEEVEEAVTLGLVPESFREEYQKNLTRGEFADLIINFLAVQYGYDLMDGRPGADYFRRDYLDNRLDSRGEPFDKSNYLPDTAGAATRYSWDYVLADCIHEFSDVSYKKVPKVPYETNKNINMAYLLGIVRGQGDGCYTPSGFITRQEMAAMMQRAYAVYAASAQAPEDGIARFTDRDAIAPWAQEGVALLAGFGVMKGDETGRFAPLSLCTREEGLLILLRLYQNMPVGRLNGNITPLLTYEEVVYSLTEGNGLAHVEYSCETDICGIYYVSYAGAPHALPSPTLFLVYPSSLYMKVPLVDPVLSEFRLNEDGTQLFFHGYRGGDYVVFLETGELSLVANPA